MVWTSAFFCKEILWQTGGLDTGRSFADDYNNISLYSFAVFVNSQRRVLFKFFEGTIEVQCYILKQGYRGTAYKKPLVIQKRDQDKNMSRTWTLNRTDVPMLWYVVVRMGGYILWAC